MRMGVSSRHAILSLPTRLRPEPARPPALSTANWWADDRRPAESQAGRREGATLWVPLRYDQQRRRGERREPAPGAGYESAAPNQQLRSAWRGGGRGQRLPHAQRRPLGPPAPLEGAGPRGRGLARWDRLRGPIRSRCELASSYSPKLNWSCEATCLRRSSRSHLGSPSFASNSWRRYLHLTGGETVISGQGLLPPIRVSRVPTLKCDLLCHRPPYLLILVC